MNSKQVRQTFLDFFQSKGHQIVPSAPMVVKNDPTLMFINSGMAPFKDWFLGNAEIKYPHVADTQKCLRVSGKHNDLEDVGLDTYHHTFFEMLGNWSFGDYFKKEAIHWAWELLTEVYKIPEDRLYVTVFEGDDKENIPFDKESYEIWKQYVPENRILKGNKKDNFWEMGDTGPCGPCTEIHCDIRNDEERKKVDGYSLVNTGHPQVIEIWNLVFMQYERKANGTLVPLPKNHVDTGMGFERLCMVLQGKQSTYDTDVFTPIIQKIEQLTGLKYDFLRENEEQQRKINIAIRVIADHIRAIAFSIADGQLPSNTGAGYVIRRILRRAIRYGFQYLQQKDPFIYNLVPVLVEQMGDAFPELKQQQPLIQNIIKEEEHNFLKTLENGLRKIEAIIDELQKQKINIIPGKIAFELYDTYGFPFDLTQLIAREGGMSVDEKEFQKHLEEQKNRSRSATAVETDDWMVLSSEEPKFVGYDLLNTTTTVVKYRTVKTKNKTLYQIVLKETPFYPEGGGQVGDTGYLIFGDEINGEKIRVVDTKKEMGVILHIVEKLPQNIQQKLIAKVDTEKRLDTARNHSATHLLHAALRKMLGTHVEQKGSLVNADYLRFDFSHFAKLTDEEIQKIEQLVNQKILENIPVEIKYMPLQDAKKMGAMALFGEKYEDIVRVVIFDKEYSIELCGGTHVSRTGDIGLFKIVSEEASSAGIRRIEAITGHKALQQLQNLYSQFNTLKELLKINKEIDKKVIQIIEENKDLKRQLSDLLKEQAQIIKRELKNKIIRKKDWNVLIEELNIPNADEVKNILFELNNEYPNFIGLIANRQKEKVYLSLIISQELVKTYNLNASQIIRELAKHIQGGGGGQPHFAQAGGTNGEGVPNALSAAKKFFEGVFV
ncbi:MAG: alanine--tRNA ligase [Bacteroidia bacterium]|nr:MAG: alanine--tRNA ligase [Bacteroidia bacterium]